MELVKPPELLHFTCDISKQLQLFKQKFEFFLLASESDKKPRQDATKIALLLTVAGDDALEIYNNFTFVTARAGKVVQLSSPSSTATARST